ncbi:ankyrin repeat-containing protein NPR4-like [Diospyros lotus]|uniref:ankyrin repeat-containing protein NPR4-like n=1 Tax=Diospyros lotus TaxID=55363 RepID=UPI0022559D53|nr:ankyrin repeat-containing protein NPR4-like [Diospyros lotus]
MRELVRHRAELAKELNSDGLRPRDIASVNGNVEIVRELVKNDAEMCRLKGKDKRTALHHAAVHGRVEVIDVLVYVCSESIKDVTAKGETALHLAVKSGQFEAFRALVDWLLRSGEEAIINQGDCEENTVLHLASIKRTNRDNLSAAAVQTTTTHQESEGAPVHLVCHLLPNNPQVTTNQYLTEHQVIKLLLEIRNSKGVKVDVNAQNSRGLTAVNILNEIKKPTPADVELRNELKSASAVASKSPVESPLGSEVQKLVLVVAVLFVTLTFQAVVKPPLYIVTTDSSVGNSWTSTSGNVTKTSVPSDHRSSASLFLLVNTVAHTASFTTIVLVTLTSRLFFRRELLVSSFCVSFVYSFLVFELADKESVPSSLLFSAFFLPPSLRLLPDLVSGVWKWLRQRREERRWTQNNVAGVGIQSLEMAETTP